MPIECLQTILPIERDAFYDLDYQVMKLAFEVHNDMGRFWDEKIYESALAARCRSTGLGSVATQVPIRVSYQDFTKTYEVDMLLNQSVVYELKAVETLTGEHRNQAINYLLLLGVNHGKLVNFRTESVQHRFVTTHLTSARRRQITVDDRRWKNTNGDSGWLKDLVLALLEEWGAFLDIQLFYEAVCHFRGGEDKVVKRIAVSDGAQSLGSQRAHLLDDVTAFKFSAITGDQKAYEQHLRRFLNYTNLHCVEWINLNHHQITFATVTK
ncbi:MAG: GxxExxY protein [Verrucomicrobiae bacterium]|nr:GxxExxY protein [Verrucomicrobiae bacterium]